MELQPQGNLLIGEGAQGEREREKKKRKIKRETGKERVRHKEGERADNKNHGQRRVA